MPRPPTDGREPTVDAVPRDTQSNSTRLPPARSHASAQLVLAYARGELARAELQAVPPQGLILGRISLTFSGQPLVDPRMSRRHAEIGRDGERWVIRDLGSRNSTRVNGRPVTDVQPLTSGDLIRLGDTLLFFSIRTHGARSTLADPDLVARSPGMDLVCEAIEAVATRDTTVLITGETGVGKDVVAGAIHRRSRRKGPFVPVNCAGLSEGVLESELFGHMRGAFTGAVANREGLFRAADGGTLFLDEIGEVPPVVQVKLLRALETSHVRPVGAVQEREVHARVIAATNKELVTEVAKGAFRADLYARLAQWIVHIPPLRQRREDLPLLMRQLLARSGASERPFDIALAEALLLHDWPLNVRGLRNVLSAAAIASGAHGRLILHPQVQLTLAADDALREPPATGGEPEAALDEPDVTLPGPDELRALLVRFHGNVAQAARHLGCSRQRFYRCLQAHGIDLSEFRSC
jgi:DNA-binding NtrC family response regulator